MNDIINIATYAKALGYARDMHENQTDKSGSKYISHPIRVSEKFCAEARWMEAVVALLHDVVEDTKVTIEDIRVLFGDQVASMVENLTRVEGESYKAYIQRIKEFEDCVEIKLEDLLDNMDLRRLPEITIKDINRNRKYLNAYETLIK